MQEKPKDKKKIAEKMQRMRESKPLIDSMHTNISKARRLAEELKQNNKSTSSQKKKKKS